MAKNKSLSRQHRGGMAAFRGQEFERFFGVVRVLGALARHCEGSNVRLALQLKRAHVDDWVEDEQRKRRYFSLKRMKRLSWSAVRTDFGKQRAASLPGKSIELHLVVRTLVQQRKLKHANGRVSGVDVVWFPNWDRPARHIESEGPARSALLSACVLDRPTRSDLEAIWKDVSFAWDNARKPGAFVGISEVVARIADQKMALIRTRWRPGPSWLAAQKVLRKVPGWTSVIRDGALLYSHASGFEGRMSCRSSEFKAFVRSVLRKQPRTLESILEILP